MPKISVIVPVYKAENTLHRCVDSIFAQTFTDFELLLIDDGSPDRSGAICDEYAKKDPRVRVFHKPNGGVSSARNLGLDNAEGEWACFVDSDDGIKSHCLATLMEFKDRDLVVADFDIPCGDSWNEIIPEGDYKDNELGDFLSEHLSLARMAAPWAKLFKRTLIGSLRFSTKLSSCEDAIFVMLYCTHIHSVHVCSDKVYDYYWCGNSLSRDFDLNHRQLPALIEQMEHAISALSQSFEIDYSKLIPLAFNGSLIKERQWFREKRASYSEIYRSLQTMRSSTAVKFFFSDSNTKDLGRRRKIFNFLFRMRSCTPAALYIYIIEHFTGRIY